VIGEPTRLRRVSNYQENLFFSSTPLSSNQTDASKEKLKLLSVAQTSAVFDCPNFREIVCRRRWNRSRKTRGRANLGVKERSEFL